jgi:hypothetical protein
VMMRQGDKRIKQRHDVMMRQGDKRIKDTTWWCAKATRGSSKDTTWWCAKATRGSSKDTTWWCAEVTWRYARAHCLVVLVHHLFTAAYCLSWDRIIVSFNRVIDSSLLQFWYISSRCHRSTAPTEHRYGLNVISSCFYACSILSSP